MRKPDFIHSLVFRWITLVTVAAAFGVGMMLLMMRYETARRLETEAAAIQSLSERKMGQRVESELVLATHRLRGIVTGLQDSAQEIAMMPGTKAALLTRNENRISQMIGPALRRAGFSGGLLVDTSLVVLGGDRDELSLLKAQAALNAHDIADTLRDLVQMNEAAMPNSYRFVGRFDHALSSLVQAEKGNQVGVLIAWPVFDPYGDIAGLLIAYRAFHPREAALQEFSHSTGASLALLSGLDVVSVAGGLGQDFLMPSPGPSGLSALNEAGLVGRCGAGLYHLTLCILHPANEVQQFAEEVFSIGAAEAARSEMELSFYALLGLIGVSGLAFLAAWQVVRPLRAITLAVDQVADGDWQPDLPPSRRKDEIGAIARALERMQIALIERDRMRQEMARIDAINQRRLAMGQAVLRFEDHIGAVMGKIGETMQAMDATQSALALAARHAEEETDRIRSSTELTTSRTTAVTGATLQLSQNAAELGARVRTVSGVIHRSEGQLRMAETQVGEVSEAARFAGQSVMTIQALAADLAALTLRASIEAGQIAGQGMPVLPIASAARSLAARTAEAAGAISTEIARMQDAAGLATDQLQEMRGELGAASSEASGIALVATEQNSATREIADGLAMAAEAMVAVSMSVDNLRANLGSAHGAVGDFSRAARRIVEDARSIDAGLREFVRDVAS